MDIGPYNVAEAVSTSDTVNLTRYTARKQFTNAIYCGTAGTVTVVFENDSTAQFTAVAGGILPVAVKRINATGTAATLIVALWRE